MRQFVKLKEAFEGKFTFHVLRQGVQLVLAVLVGYGLAAALGLPERFWVVITVLIVMRADAGSTMVAGWDRVCGTIVGAIIGVLGTYAQQQGTDSAVLTLVIVCSLAFLSSIIPMLRSATIASLIVLAAGQLAGHSTMDAALMRVAQIAIGVLASVAVSQVTSKFRTRGRLIAGSAAVLRNLARQLKERSYPTPFNEAVSEARGIAMRNALLGLAELAVNADRTFPWSRFNQRTLHERHHRRIAALTSRVVQDSVVLNRVLDGMLGRQFEANVRDAIDSVFMALTSTADMLDGGEAASLHALRKTVIQSEIDTSLFASLSVSPTSFLLRDLQKLCALQIEIQEAK